MSESVAIPLEDICEKIMNGTVMDVFFVILRNKHVYKTELINEFALYGKDIKKTKYRYTVDIAIAKLEAALLIESASVGTKEIYYLTEYGIAAKDIVSMIVTNQPIRLMNSVILKEMEKGTPTETDNIQS